MLFRFFILIVAIPILVWVFLSVLAREVGSAVWHAWNETLINLDQMRATFKSKSLNKEDWL